MGIGLIYEWKKRLPEFWHFGQELLLKLIHPDHPLAVGSHRALVDAKKLQILFEDKVDDSARKRTGFCCPEIRPNQLIVS